MLGYRGEGQFKDAAGAVRFDKMLATDKSNTYPWFLRYEKMGIKRDTKAKVYEETCVVYRDFETSWSEIQLKGGHEIDMHLGFYMFTNLNVTQPSREGFVENYKL